LHGGCLYLNETKRNRGRLAIVIRVFRNFKPRPGSCPIFSAQWSLFLARSCSTYRQRGRFPATAFGLRMHSPQLQEGLLTCARRRQAPGHQAEADPNADHFAAEVADVRDSASPENRTDEIEEHREKGDFPRACLKTARQGKGEKVQHA